MPEVSKHCSRLHLKRAESDIVLLTYSSVGEVTAQNFDCRYKDIKGQEVYCSLSPTQKCEPFETLKDRAMQSQRTQTGPTLFPDIPEIPSELEARAQMRALGIR